MKICFIAGSIYPVLSSREQDYRTIGGAEVQQFLLAQELTCRNVEVCFISEDYGQGSYSRAEGFDVYGYQFTSNKLKQTLSIWDAMLRADPNVYVVRGIPNYLCVIQAFCLIKRRKLILSMSTNLSVLPRKISSLTLIAYIPFRLAIKWASAIVAQTIFQKTMLKSNFRAKNITLISNGASSSSEPFLPGKSDRVVWLASIHPRKGPEDILELARMMPCLKFQIGGGPWRDMGSYFQRIKEQAESLSNVEWLGYVSHDCVDQLLSGALALVNTTRTAPGLENVEGFPNIYLEAWRNGVPTLTLHNDPDEVICDNGLGFHCKDLTALATALETLSKNADLRTEMGMAALKYFQTNHTISDAATKYIDLLNSINQKE
jgi:glycosyltransferase involved in cell wall biosynthesis